MRRRHHCRNIRDHTLHRHDTSFHPSQRSSQRSTRQTIRRLQFPSTQRTQLMHTFPQAIQSTNTRQQQSHARRATVIHKTIRPTPSWITNTRKSTQRSQRHRRDTTTKKTTRTMYNAKTTTTLNRPRTTSNQFRRQRGPSSNTTSPATTDVLQPTASVQRHQQTYRYLRHENTVHHREPATIHRATYRAIRNTRSHGLHRAKHRRQANKLLP